MPATSVGSCIQHYEANPRGRDFVCGDIHGGWSLLEQALADRGFDRSRDRLFCVGDLIDRGPQSAQFPDYLAAPWFHAVLGNHEQMALRTCLADDSEAGLMWRLNGGAWIDEIPKARADELVGQLACLPLALEVAGFGDEPVVVVHADVPGDDWTRVRQWLQSECPQPWAVAEPLQRLLWGRRRLQRASRDRIKGARHLFHGHSVVEEVVTLGNRTYLDTGSVMTGRISVLEMGQWLRDGSASQSEGDQGHA